MKTLKGLLQKSGFVGAINAGDWEKVVGRNLGERSGVVRVSGKTVVVWAESQAIASELDKVTDRILAGLSSLGLSFVNSVQTRVTGGPDGDARDEIGATNFPLVERSEGERIAISKAVSVVQDDGLREAMEVWLNRRPINTRGEGGSHE